MAEVDVARISDNGDSISTEQFSLRSSEINGPGAELSKIGQPAADVKSKSLKRCVSGEGNSGIRDETTESDGNILVNGCISCDTPQQCEHDVSQDVNTDEEKVNVHYVEEGHTESAQGGQSRDVHAEHEEEFQHKCCGHHHENPQHTAHRTTQPIEVEPETPTMDLAEDMSRLSLDASSKSDALEARDVNTGIAYVGYESEKQMPDIMRLITKDLSEPYSIYTYRYFIHNWPDLCFLAMDKEKCVGAIVCKLDVHKKMAKRGYIAMLAVDENYRRKQIGSSLVRQAIYAMVHGNCDEVVLETEITNKAALRLYENLGFVRDKRLFRYYLNGVDALRLKLWLR